MDTTEKYQDLIDQILSSLPKDQTLEVIDDQVFLNPIREKYKQKTDRQYEIRNKLYTELLDFYKTSNQAKCKSKKYYKLFFFIIVNLVFVGLVVFFIVCIYQISVSGLTKDFTTSEMVASLGGIIGSISGIITSIVVLPQIIAQHLFPTDEDKNMIELVKSMQDNDSGIRKVLSGDNTPDEKPDKPAADSGEA